MQLDRKTMSRYYANCITETCPLMDKCLRSLAWRTRGTTEEIVIINPEKTPGGTTCPYHRPATTLRYAYGFTRMTKDLPRGQYSTFRLAGIRLFSRSGYYRRRTGEQPLSPLEQQQVLAAMQRAGVTDPGDFDHYEYRPAW